MHCSIRFEKSILALVPGIVNSNSELRDLILILRGDLNKEEMYKTIDQIFDKRSISI